MAKRTNWRQIGTLAGLLLTGLAIVFGLSVRDWREWLDLLGQWGGHLLFLRVPLWGIILTCFGLGGIGAFLRLRRIRSRRSYGPFGIAWARYGYTELGYPEWDGVLWRLRSPNPSPLARFAPPLEGSGSTPSEIAERLEVAGPFCPRCKTELEQQEKFFGGYMWRCPREDFAQKKRRSIYEARDSAIRVFRRAVENKITG